MKTVGVNVMLQFDTEGDPLAETYRVIDVINEYMKDMAGSPRILSSAIDQMDLQVEDALEENEE